MHKQPKVSVTIITYNQQEFIAEAIESAVRQDYENLEVVVADDCSTDGTPQIIRQFVEKYPGRVKGICGDKNVGVTGNSNRALNACDGEFIAFQGGDDVLLPGKISKQVEWLLGDTARSLCGHKMEYFYEDASRDSHIDVITASSGRGAERIIADGVPYGATAIMVRRASIPEWGFDERVGTASDYLLWIDVVANGGIYGHIDGVYARHRRHGLNVTNRRLSYIDDIRTSYEIAASRYPHLKHVCYLAIAKNYYYYKGVLLLEEHRGRDARHEFMRSIRMLPFYGRSWVRLAQSFVIVRRGAPRE